LVPLYVWPFAALIAGLWYGPPIALGRALSFKPLTYLGKISYGMYLYHMALIDVVKRTAIWSSGETGVHLRFAIVVVVYVLCVICIASLSYYFIEKPFLQIGARFRAQPAIDKNGGTQHVLQPAHLSLALDAQS
jgi:peptidoglycan/LPS O-acetylase OafA/YrhL